ncbi:MAG TPA: pseudouridine-5'-phosphate glycosidase [Anaerolineales bacterium]|jgi:pseudouridine-5'-phosphate glycosidase|nr:pseudouridine-5'-phosphate glycosidase [Anaerolineales bacterium]
MPVHVPKHFQIHSEIYAALDSGDPVVALESTVISHGLPYPENLQLAQDMEVTIRAGSAHPATIGLIDGKVHVGLEPEGLSRLAQGNSLRKISVRDFGPAIAQKASGGTTVAGTLIAAERVGIKIFATGGIGGVHRDAPFDISTDLGQLAKSKVVVVCAGAKSILDLPATLEQLETLAVPVLGYQTGEFPAFYSRASGLPVSASVESAEETAQVAKAHWELGGGGLLVVVPIPEDDAIPFTDIEAYINIALAEAEHQQIRGQAVTPFLLKRVSELSGGDSLQANLSLLKNNARTAAQIAQFLYTPKGKAAV